MTTPFTADPWKTLGVERSSDKAEIRTAYKKLVLQCHPDKVQDPTLKALKQNEFQKVQQAYELLNDDVERAKYEQKLKAAEMQRSASKIQHDLKNAPNSSVPRSSTRYSPTTYDIRPDVRSAESPKYKEYKAEYKTSSSPTGGKIYTHYTAHTRSHEEMPSTRIYPVYEEGDRQARRTASYEKPSKRDEERRDRDKEERRRRKDVREEEEPIRSRDREREQRDKEREREKEKAEREKEREREARKADRKRLDKERERERKRDLEDKHSSRSPYIERQGAVEEELWAEDEAYVTSRSEKKRSSSKKHDETREDREREREKSTSRRAKSSDRKPADTLDDAYLRAASYIQHSGGSIPTNIGIYTVQRAPTPPQIDLEENIQRSSARAAGRRSSHDAARSKEKLRYETIDTTKARPIPKLAKSYSMPVSTPESPPRVSRSNTAPQSYDRHPPSLPRSHTYLASGVVDDRRPTAEYYDDHESDDDHERRRRSRRSGRSPAPVAIPVRYKVVDGIKTSKLEAQAQYAYGESPNSKRRYATEGLDAHHGHSPSGGATYANAPFKVKEGRSYGANDVAYSEYQPPYNQPYYAGDGYPVGA